MKITFFSNFLNHHQIPVSDAFYHMFGSDYTFVACEKVPEERIQLGYKNQFDEHPYLLEIHDNQENYHKALQLGHESDIVIIGSADEIFIKERIKLNKLTFRYSERLFKTNKHVLLYPYLILKRYRLDTALRKKNVYLLSSSAFTPLDYTMFLSYPKRFLKWGYFPETRTYDIHQLMDQKFKSTNLEMLWVGRMIDWKRPFDAIHLIEKLVQESHHVHLTMVGTGPLEPKIKASIESKNLQNHITLVGPVDADQVRQYMEHAAIYLMTSTKEEGWGAVVNEAMNSGCVVYAYYRVGSAPYLIEHGVNGKLYVRRSHLYKQVLLDTMQTEYLKEMGTKAYKTIHETWNASQAVKSFIEVASALLKHEQPAYPIRGPLSKAPIMTSCHVKRAMKSKGSHVK